MAFKDPPAVVAPKTREDFIRDLMAKPEFKDSNKASLNALMDWADKKIAAGKDRKFFADWVTTQEKTGDQGALLGAKAALQYFDFMTKKEEPVTQKIPEEKKPVEAPPAPKEVAAPKALERNRDDFIRDLTAKPEFKDVNKANLVALMDWVDKRIATGKTREFFEGWVATQEKTGDSGAILGAKAALAYFEYMTKKEEPATKPASSAAPAVEAEKGALVPRDIMERIEREGIEPDVVALSSTLPRAKERLPIVIAEYRRTESVECLQEIAALAQVVNAIPVAPFMLPRSIREKKPAAPVVAEKKPVEVDLKAFRTEVSGKFEDALTVQQLNMRKSALDEHIDEKRDASDETQKAMHRIVAEEFEKRKQEIEKAKGGIKVEDSILVGETVIQAGGHEYRSDGKRLFVDGERAEVNGVTGEVLVGGKKVEGASFKDNVLVVGGSRYEVKVGGGGKGARSKGFEEDLKADQEELDMALKGKDWINEKKHARRMQELEREAKMLLAALAEQSRAGFGFKDGSWWLAGKKLSAEEMLNKHSLPDLAKEDFKAPKLPPKEAAVEEPVFLAGIGNDAQAYNRDMQELRMTAQAKDKLDATKKWRADVELIEREYDDKVGILRHALGVVIDLNKTRDGMLRQLSDPVARGELGFKEGAWWNGNKELGGGEVAKQGLFDPRGEVSLQKLNALVVKVKEINDAAKKK